MNGDRAVHTRGLRAVGLLPLLLVGACASPGPPRPPSLNLPEVISTFAAVRVEGGVQLHWTTPETTTDGLTVRGPMTAVICRRAVVSSGSTCAVVLRLSGAAGPSQGVDQLPPALVAGGPVALEYRLKILNAGGHSAGESPAVFAVGGSAPPDLEQLHVAASQEGAVLTWGRTDAPGAVELHRVTIEPTRPGRQPATGAKRAVVPDVTLRVPSGEGALDRTARMGERYTYTAQRVRTVNVGERNLEVRGAVSAPVTVEMRDVFPPRQPFGLDAVAGDHVVDLSWEPNTEPDLAGYVVLRQETGPLAQLNPSPIAEPAFRDKTAAPGHTYRYSIVAVDRAGNRSPAGGPVSVSLRSDVP